MLFRSDLAEKKSNYIPLPYSVKGNDVSFSGLYRLDYAKHVGLEDGGEKQIDAILLTHAHVDHCGYIKYLRPDIPIYCSEESRLIMKNFDDTGKDEQYLNATEKFQLKEGKSGKTKGEMVKETGQKIERKIVTFESNKKFSID